MATSITSRLRPLISARVARVVDAVRERLPPRVQRIGAQTFQRARSRWPVLDELLRALRSVGASEAPPEAPSGAGADQSAWMAQDPQNARFVPVDDLAAQLESAPDWETRVHAAATLADFDAPTVVDALTRALRDRSAEVAAAAAAALAKQRDSRALVTLRAVVKNLDGYLSPVTRAAALSGLGRRLAESDFQPVLDALHDVDAEVSIAAIAAVVKRMPEKASAHLLPIVRDESSYFLPLVRVAAAHALERTGVLTPAIAAELLQRERDADVRRVLERVASPLASA